MRRAIRRRQRSFHPSVILEQPSSSYLPASLHTLSISNKDNTNNTMGQEGGEVINQETTGPTATGTASSFVSVEFEVYGQVQGCYFTKYCKDACDQMNLGGWVKNSKKGTIVGKVQGEKTRVEEIVQWLSRTGSPGCKIDHTELRNWEYISRLEFRSFSIRF